VVAKAGGRLKATRRAVAAVGLRAPRRTLALPISAPMGIDAIDGLRALAVGLVVWHHVYVALNGMPGNPALGPRWLQDVAGLAFCGVNLFFVLSGFLLFLPYARAILNGRVWPSLGRFYWRRVLRIVPGYFATLAVLLLVVDRFMLSRQHLRDVILTALMLHDTNATTFNIIAYQVNVAFWTLAVEWQFYLLLPWIALVLARIAGARTRRAFPWRLGLALGAITAAGLAERWLASVVYYDWHQYYPVEAPHGMGVLIAVLYGMKGKFIEVFALGMGISLLYVRFVESGRIHSRVRAMVGWGAAVLAVVGLAACLPWAIHDHRIPNTIPYAWVFPPDGRLWSIFGEWVLGICFALLLVAVLMGPPAMGAIFAWRPLRFIGIISYSIYLCHLPIIHAMSSQALQHPATAYIRLALWTVVMVPLVSVAVYLLIERPFLRLRLAAHAPAELAVTSGGPRQGIGSPQLAQHAAQQEVPTVPSEARGR
jgi:peptidoglycan/LPS O-acetylase OafA/YrhL